MPGEVEVDPKKICMQRWAHRDVVGEDRSEGRFCPECFPTPIEEEPPVDFPM